MRKKASLAALFLALALVLSGCWNYISLNAISIVAGIAVDMDPLSDEFNISYEIVDLTKDIKSGGLKSLLIEAKGKTIFDAARNAKRRLEKKLYFGNTNTLIISEEVARKGHILHIIDWFCGMRRCVKPQI